jgi:hypothetical protein
MAWKCCGLCRIAHADDDERPFSERQDMEQSNGRWNWSLTTEHRGIYVRASRRVSGSGAFLGVTLRHKIGPTLYHDQSFALFWSEGYGGREKPFLYCGATIDAEDAASIICCKVEPGSPSVEAVEILVSDYVPYLGRRAVCIGLVLYDSQGREIARKTTAMPLAVNRNYFGFRLEGISFADFERVDVGMLQSPDEPCCARPPWIQCEDYEYASGQLNYLARPFFFLPTENARYQLLRADTIVKAPTDGGFLWELGLGDCCAGARFRIEVSRAAGDNRVTVSLIRECQHGGPVVMRQSRLAAANWDPTEDYVDVPVSVCIRHIAVLFGDPQELFVDSVVSVNTPWGLVTWIGVFAYIDWSTTCAYNLGGFLYADLIVVDLMCGAGMTFTKALLDRCFCQAYPTPQPGLSKCLDLVCTGAPPQRDPPSGWLLSVSNLPDELQLLDWPQPVGEYISDCPGGRSAPGPIR